MSGGHRYWLQHAAVAPPTHPVGPTPRRCRRNRYDLAGGTDTTAAVGNRRSAGAEGDITIGVAWNNFNERWANADKPAIQAVLEEAGAAHRDRFCSSAEQQLAGMENLIAERTP